MLESGNMSADADGSMTSNEDNDKSAETANASLYRESKIGLGLIFGASLGTVLGIFLGNFLLGMIAGIVIGVVIGIVLTHIARSQHEVPHD